MNDQKIEEIITAFIEQNKYMSIIPHSILRLFITLIREHPEIFKTSEEHLPPDPLLPLYKCHKRVRAGKIVHIELIQLLSLPPRFSANLYFSGDIVKNVTHEFFEKHQPYSGGYFVEYEDGYTSFSPAEAFEAGYELILDKNETK